MSQKVRKGKNQHLGHHALIKMIAVDALNKLRIHVLWSKFMDMDRETFIDTQTLTPCETPASSVGGREGKEEEEEVEAEEERETKVEKIGEYLE